MPALGVTPHSLLYPQAFTKEAASGLLRKQGLKVTGARCAVLMLMVNSPTPLSHAEVTEALLSPPKNAGLASDYKPASMDRATIYRNLLSLTEAKLLERLDYDDNVWRFRYARHHQHTAVKTEALPLEGVPPTLEHEQHPHFVCTQCKQHTCLPASALVSLLEKLPEGLASISSIVVRGLCVACQGKAALPVALSS